MLFQQPGLPRTGGNLASPPTGRAMGALPALVLFKQPELPRSGGRPAINHRFETGAGLVALKNVKRIRFTQNTSF